MKIFNLFFIKCILTWNIIAILTKECILYNKKNKINCLMQL